LGCSQRRCRWLLSLGCSYHHALLLALPLLVVLLAAALLPRSLTCSRP
jgi:hypothetical protein